MTILPQLEHDLFDAAKQRLPAADTPDQGRDHPRRPEPRTTRRAGARRRLAATATTLPILLAVAVTVIVAAFALTLIHHGRPSPPAEPATSVRATRQQLIQMLSVLSRPQTKADRDPELDPGFLGLTSIPERLARRHQRPPAGLERRLAQLGYPKLDRALVRVVKIPEWHAKVGIEPATWQPSPSSPQRSEGVALALWIGTKPTIPPSSEDGTGPQLTSVETFRAHGLALTNHVRGTNRMDGVFLVPDGVAKVTLRVSRVSESPVKVNPSQFGTATATVHDNLAAFQLTLPTASPVRRGVGGTFGIPGVAQTTWFDVRGTVIKHTTTNLDVLIKVRGTRTLPSPPRRHRRALP